VPRLRRYRYSLVAGVRLVVQMERSGILAAGCRAANDVDTDVIDRRGFGGGYNEGRC